jgi:FkbM family methyltransferase
MMTSLRFREYVKGFLEYIRKGTIPRISWSQSGEDLVLDSLLSGIDKGFFIDLGAHDPVVISVTKLFYDRGWNGINVEANPYRYEELVKFRTRDINLNYAISNEEGFATLYLMSSSSMSTTKSSIAKKLEAEGRTKIVETLNIESKTLRKIFDEFVSKSVNFMNIDIEGQDLAALESLEFQTLEKCKWPEIISLENTLPLSNTLELSSVTYLLNIGYEIYCVLPHVVILKYSEKFIME